MDIVVTWLWKKRTWGDPVQTLFRSYCYEVLLQFIWRCTTIYFPLVLTVFFRISNFKYVPLHRTSSVGPMNYVLILPFSRRTYGHTENWGLTEFIGNWSFRYDGLPDPVLSDPYSSSKPTRILLDRRGDLSCLSSSEVIKNQSLDTLLLRKTYKSL